MELRIQKKSKAKKTYAKSIYKKRKMQTLKKLNYVTQKYFKQK